MRHDADLVSGPEYRYLGHFAQRQFLCMGHNTVQDGVNADVQPENDMNAIVPGPDRTKDQNEFHEQYRSQQYSPGVPSLKRMNYSGLGQDT